MTHEAVARLFGSGCFFFLLKVFMNRDVVAGTIHLLPSCDCSTAIPEATETTPSFGVGENENEWKRGSTGHP